MAKTKKNTAVEDVGVSVPKPSGGGGSKGGKRRKSASRKAHYAAGPLRITRNKARRAAARKRRAEYWASTEGQERKAAKVNTPEKLKAREQWRVDRASRRRERALAEQKARVEAARQASNESVKVVAG